MAVRAASPFEERLLQFGELDARVVERALYIIRQLPLGVRLPHPIPLEDGGIVLEWDRGAVFADLELRPDLAVITSVMDGNENTQAKFDGLDEPEFREFLNLVARRFRS